MVVALAVSTQCLTACAGSQPSHCSKHPGRTAPAQQVHFCEDLATAAAPTVDWTAPVGDEAGLLVPMRAIPMTASDLGPPDFHPPPSIFSLRI